MRSEGHPWLTSLKRRLYPLTSLLTLRVGLVRGRPAAGDEPVTLLLVGDGWFLKRVAGLISGDQQVLWTRRIGLPMLGRLLRKHADAYALAFVVLSPWQRRFLPRGESHQGCLQISQVLEMGDSWAQVRAHFSRRLREATNGFEAKRGFQCRVSHSREDFDHFYERMYVPQARSRFGVHANLASPAQLRETFSAGFLLMIERQGHSVAAALCTEHAGILHYNKGGVLDGDVALMRAGAEMAIYYFLIHHALKHGDRKIDCGDGMPFLSDGVVQHKSLWGALLRESQREPQSFDVLGGHDRAHAARFLHRHPILVSSESGVQLLAAQSAACADGQGEPAAEAIERWCKLGLHGVSLLGDRGWRILELRELELRD